MSRGHATRGLSLILASSMALGSLSPVFAETITGDKGDTLWVGKDWSGKIFITDEICRDALHSLFINFERDFSDASVRTTEMYGIRNRFRGFLNIYFGRNVENLSNAQVLSMYQSNQAAIDLDAILQNTLIKMEAQLPYVKREQGEVAFYTPPNFGSNSSAKWRMKFILEKVGYDWRIARAYTIEDIPGSPEHEFVEIYDHNPGPTDWELGRVKREKTIPSEPIPKTPSQTTPTNPPVTQTTRSPNNTNYPEDSYGNITSAGVGDMLYDFEIAGKKFDFGIANIFRMKICEADLYDRPLESSKRRFYEVFITRYAGRSQAGLGRSFIRKDNLIIDVDGRVVLPYVRKQATRINPNDKMPPLGCRNPVYWEKLFSSINRGISPETDLYTNEASFTFLNIPYLIDGPDWISSDGTNYYKKYYTIQRNGPVYVISDNGKSITINPSEAPLVSLEELLRQ